LGFLAEYHQQIHVNPHGSFVRGFVWVTVGLPPPCHHPIIHPHEQLPAVVVAGAVSARVVGVAWG